MAAYNDLADSKHGRYCLQVNDEYALDCYDTYMSRTCLASCGNSYHNIIDKTTIKTYCECFNRSNKE
jgi:hypothetical protein